MHTERDRLEIVLDLETEFEVIRPINLGIIPSKSFMLQCYIKIFNFEIVSTAMKKIIKTR